MESELKDIKPLGTQEEYESALKNKDFVCDAIIFGKNKILGLAEEIANEWRYVSNYEMILEDLNAQILSWEAEQEDREKCGLTTN